MNKHVYVGLPILEMSKSVMYEVWNDYIKLKYGEKQMISIKTLLKMLKLYLTLEIKGWKNKKVTGITNNEFCGKTMKKFLVLKVKTYSYGSEDKKVKGRKSVSSKENLNLKNIKIV